MRHNFSNLWNRHLLLPTLESTPPELWNDPGDILHDLARDATGFDYVRDKPPRYPRDQPRLHILLLGEDKYESLVAQEPGRTQTKELPDVNHLCADARCHHLFTRHRQPTNIIDYVKKHGHLG